MKHKNLYLIKDKELPMDILDNSERVEAICRVSLGMYNYRVISEGEANLLKPNIEDYHNNQMRA